jgi:hypothetical protein
LVLSNGSKVRQDDTPPVVVEHPTATQRIEGRILSSEDLAATFAKAKQEKLAKIADKEAKVAAAVLKKAEKEALEQKKQQERASKMPVQSEKGQLASTPPKKKKRVGDMKEGSTPVKRTKKDVVKVRKFVFVTCASADSLTHLFRSHRPRKRRIEMEKARSCVIDHGEDAAGCLGTGRCLLTSVLMIIESVVLCVVAPNKPNVPN